MKTNQTVYKVQVGNKWLYFDTPGAAESARNKVARDTGVIVAVEKCVKRWPVRYAPVKGIAAELEADSRYSPHYDPACAAALATGEPTAENENQCDCCDGRGTLSYRGFRGRGEYRAIAVCSRCGHEFDF